MGKKLESIGGGDWADQLAKLNEKISQTDQTPKEEEVEKPAIKTEAENATIKSVGKETPKIEEGAPQGLGKGDGDENQEKKEVAKLTLTELIQRGYDINSPEVNEALKISKAETKRKEDAILKKFEDKKENHEKREGEIAKMQFESMIRDIKTLESTGRRYKNDREKMELWQKISEKYNLGIVSIKPVEEGGNKAKELAVQKYEEIMKEIGEVLKEGIDKVVIHGSDFYDKGTGDVKGLKFKNDLDTLGALYFLNDVANVKYKEGASSEIVEKGSQSKENTGNILYVDVGGRIVGVEKTRSGKKAFIDHHQEGYRAHETSATQIMYDALVKNGMIEKEEPWMKDLVKFTTNMDNLQYVREKNFNLKFFKEKWPKSLYAIAEKVPFEYVVQWFKEGRDPINPFTEDEIKSMKVIIYDKNPQVERKTPRKLSGIIKSLEEKSGKSLANISFAKEQMIKTGIKTYTEELGGVVFNTTEEVKDVREGKNPINEIPINGFIPATAMGYDTFVSYNAQTQRYFINSVSHDLTNVYNRIKKLVPGTKLVRGVMILPARDASRKQMTPEKLLEILGLKE